MAKLRFGAHSGLAFFTCLCVDAISFHQRRAPPSELSGYPNARTPFKIDIGQRPQGPRLSKQGSKVFDPNQTVDRAAVVVLNNRRKR